MITSSNADLLNDLIAHGEDVVKTCEISQEEENSEEVRSALADLAGKHAAAIGALKRDVLDAGEETTESGTLLGAAARVIADFKTTHLDSSEQLQTLEALRLHERWLSNARALIVSDLPRAQRDILNLHFEEVVSAAVHLDKLIRAGA